MKGLWPVMSVLCVLAGLAAAVAIAWSLARGDLLGAILYAVAASSAFRASTDFARLSAWLARERSESGASE